MSEKIESLVPPPELCKRIPVGAFNDSALVWQARTDTIELEWIVVPRDQAEPIMWRLPAPTLEEILMEIICDYVSVLVQSKDNEKNLATRALEFWFKIQQ